LEAKGLGRVIVGCQYGSPFTTEVLGIYTTHVLFAMKMSAIDQNLAENADAGGTISEIFLKRCLSPEAN
jgi:hypothetical protein